MRSRGIDYASMASDGLAALERSLDRGVGGIPCDGGRDASTRIRPGVHPDGRSSGPCVRLAHPIQQSAPGAIRRSDAGRRRHDLNESRYGRRHNAYRADVGTDARIVDAPGAVGAADVLLRRPWFHAAAGLCAARGTTGRGGRGHGGIARRVRHRGVARAGGTIAGGMDFATDHAERRRGHLFTAIYRRVGVTGRVGTCARPLLIG